MPRYDYRCTGCRAEREASVPTARIDELRVIVCLECGGDMTRRPGLGNLLRDTRREPDPQRPSSHHHCRDAIRLTRPNPLLPATGRSGAD